MNQVTQGALVGGVYGAASVAIVPSFVGVIGRFLMYNVVEFAIIFVLSGSYNGLTGQDALDRRFDAAAPKEAQLVVTNPRVVMDGDRATQMMTLTFANRSKAAVENVRFHCTWQESSLNRYEDRVTRDEAITTLWVLQRFEPGTVNQIRVGVTGRFNRESRPSHCTVMYDEFDLGQAIRGN